MSLRSIASALPAWALLAAAMLVGPMGPAQAADYLREIWNPAHTPEQMANTADAQCLSCHREVLGDKPARRSTSGIEAKSVTAWYQTLDTYTGEQDSFHRRHLATPYAKKVMNLGCNTCHLGHDPREEASVPMLPAAGQTPVATLRKQVNPEKTCLLCHGKFPAANMGLEGDWNELRAGLESPEAPNGCLTCHAETFRTARHKVNYLKADAIEKAAAKDSDVCFGCHGGRSWYRISYPYPRHAWPGMPDEVPDWAENRPTESDPRHLIAAKNNRKK